MTWSAFTGPPVTHLARLAVDGWELESAVARHERAPASFHIPPPEERENVAAAQAVKLLFRIGAAHTDDGFEGVERMWVYVVGRSEGLYRGRLQQQPVSSAIPAPGTEVWFGPEHIADIETPPEDWQPV